METAIWIISCIILCFIASNQAWQKVVLKATVNRQKEIIELQRETIANQNGTIDAYKSILAEGVKFDGKPIWLTPKLIEETKELWSAVPNRRVDAAKKIQNISLENGKKLTLQETCDLIKKHCL
jgi:uncharacterized protein YlzI (FlbEa/FlbD family)